MLLFQMKKIRKESSVIFNQNSWLWQLIYNNDQRNRKRLEEVVHEQENKRKLFMIIDLALEIVIVANLY